MAEAIARLKNYPTSPRKMRYVADMVRGMEVEKAMNILQHASKSGAKPMGKLLRSAIDNWEKKNEGLRIEDAQLYVKTLFVDGGVTLKRWLPAPQGRAYKKRKRSNHITLIIDSKEKTERVKKKDAARKQEVTAVEPPAMAPEINQEVSKKKSKKKVEQPATT